MTTSDLKVSNELIRINRLIKFSEWTTPLNDGEQKKIFLKNYKLNKVINPQYIYKKPKNLDKIKEELLSLLTKTNNTMYINAIIKGAKQIEFLQSVSDDDTQVMTNGIPNPDMVALAKQTIPKEKGRAQKRNITAKDAKTGFIEYFKSYDLKDWKVKIKREMVPKASIEGSKKTLYIADRKYSLHEINNLIAHEIEVHALRALNGYNQKSPIFAMGTSHYLRTEEGLAIMMEQLTGNYNPQRFKFFAARIIACDLAITKSFHYIFDKLVKRYNISKHNAYIITKRVKRGTMDTSKPGGYIKDHVYFEGFHMIKKFMQDGGDIRPLFAGKINLDEIHLVKDGTLKYPKVIPKAVEAHYHYRSEQKVLI